MTDILKLARETDERLAELYRERLALDQQLGSVDSSILSDAGAHYYYRGRRRVTDMRIEEALAIVTAELTQVDAYKATHSVTEDDGWVRTDWKDYRGRIMPYDIDSARARLIRRDELLHKLEKNGEAADRLDALYLQHRWARFFLVTSSPGHIHSSMACSTCRPTTTFGWLPELSGHAEREAVEKYGPALCTVCYPTAPLEWTSDTIKKAAAARAAEEARLQAEASRKARQR